MENNENQRKLDLISALEKERIRLSDFGHNPREHNIAIDYLKTGKTTSDPDQFPLLDACMHDYETLLSDYNC